MHPKVAQAKHLSLVSPVELAKNDQIVGTIFRKQIMSYGRWVNPNWWWEEELWMELTEEIADQMIDNFTKKTFGKHISVPRNHTGDVNANAGEVIKLEKGNGGLWAYLDIRDEKTVEDIEKGRIFDVSMGFDFDYVDQKEGLRHGATLIHVALVTDPYLNNMDDFKKTDSAELSKRYEQWSHSFGFGNESKSIIMMSKHNVEELKPMELSKITNDKEYAVEVTYKNEDGEDVTVTVEPGAEVEVPETVSEEVTQQIADSQAPEAEETEEEKAAREEEERKAAEEEQKKKDEEAEANKATESEKEELSRLRAEKAYDTLLAKGKIVPAQKNLFMALRNVSELSLNAEITTLSLNKGDKTSAIKLMSAILEAGPQAIKTGEKGKQEEEAVKGKLSKEQEERLSKAGFNVETFKKQLEKGTISLEDLEEK